jgi:hypothetical protein
MLPDEVERRGGERSLVVRLPFEALAAPGGDYVVAAGALMVQFGRQPARGCQAQRRTRDRLTVSLFIR